ncbi:MAG: hypothetical protein JRF36_00200 [Deltaproteobacteria bacterium]|nr:hypothetical protein [Deltaproteobacteria bacterium]MBW2468241.1 hypothetical protein [Deltaproteobacteria bacterium]
MALAWLLHPGEAIVPIPGARKQSRVTENAAAAGNLLGSRNDGAHLFAGRSGYGQRADTGVKFCLSACSDDNIRPTLDLQSFDWHSGLH